MKVTPRRILEMGWDFAKSRTLATAVELDLFTRIASGAHTAEEISRAADSSLRGMAMLLNALVGIGLLKKDRNGNYRLAPDSGEFLVRGKPAYLGDMSMHTAYLSEAWGRLTDSVKSGRPYMRVDQRKTGEDFFQELVKALFNVNYHASRYAALYLKRKGRKVSDILDVGAGSGVWGIGIAQEFKRARLAAIDFPAVCDITRRYVKNFGMDDRFECIEGDIRAVDFGKNRHDLIILGNICHSEGRPNTERLLKRSYDALKANGSLLIAEFLPNDERTGPAIPLLFALNMLVNTDEGDVFTIGQFREWLTAGGFREIEILEKAPSLCPLILARK